MKNKSQHIAHLTMFHSKLENIHLDLVQIAKSNGLLKRKPKKITPSGLLSSICLMVVFTKCSLATWAAITAFGSRLVVSKQALQKRISPNLVAFLQEILLTLISHFSHFKKMNNKGLFSQFKRVIAQDSTNVQLATQLAKFYPGSKNQTNKISAIMRIQTVFDLLNNSFVHLRISPFTRNDQTAAHDILRCLEKDDLIIRDLGYFVLSNLKEIARHKAYFLSRYRHATAVFSTTGEKINLLQELEKNGRVDREVLLGTNTKLPVRLVAVPVNPKVANERRRKLMQNRDRRMKPNKEKLKMQDWVIFITNVEKKVWNTHQVCDIYGLRWRIEIIFKAWKSHFKFQQMPVCKSKYYIESIIFARFIVIVLFFSKFQNLSDSIKTGNNPKHISLLKISSFITANYWILVYFSRFPGSMEILEQLILKFCTYEKRRRKNYPEIFEKMLSLNVP
jgi:hypothetical protein